MNPRNAGISIYRGREVGSGEWEPLITEDMFRAVVQLLEEPGRKPTQGVTTMLGGLALCQCGNYITAGTNRHGGAVYRCNPQTREDRPGPHVQVKRADVDKAIGALVVGRLSMPDAVDLLAPKAKGDTRALRDEAQAIRAKLARLGELYMDGKIDEADLISGRQKGNARLAAIEAELAELGHESVLAPLVAAQNVAAEWGKMATDRKRAVIGALMIVTLHPAGRGARVLDPDKVISVEWKAAVSSRAVTTRSTAAGLPARRRRPAGPQEGRERLLWPAYRTWSPDEQPSSGNTSDAQQAFRLPAALGLGLPAVADALDNHRAIELSEHPAICLIAVAGSSGSSGLTSPPST